jgi:hypothetical protein
MKFYHVTTVKAWRAIKKEGILFGVHGHGEWIERNKDKGAGSYRYTYLSPWPLLGYGSVVLQVDFNPKREDFGKIHNYGFDPPQGEVCWQFSVFQPISLSDVRFCFWRSLWMLIKMICKSSCYS